MFEFLAPSFTGKRTGGRMGGEVSILPRHRQPTTTTRTTTRAREERKEKTHERVGRRRPCEAVLFRLYPMVERPRPGNQRARPHSSSSSWSFPESSPRARRSRRRNLSRCLRASPRRNCPPPRRACFCLLSLSESKHADFFYGSLVVVDGDDERNPPRVDDDDSTLILTQSPRSTSRS